VKLNIKQIQITLMQELMFRLNDYFFSQFLYAATDANPYQEIIAKLKEEIDPFSEGTRSKERTDPMFSVKSTKLMQRIEESFVDESSSSGSYCDGQSSEPEEVV
jgi:hypothetical protein